MLTCHTRVRVGSPKCAPFWRVGPSICQMISVKHVNAHACEQSAPHGRCSEQTEQIRHTKHRFGAHRRGETERGTQHHHPQTRAASVPRLQRGTCVAHIDNAVRQQHTAHTCAHSAHERTCAHIGQILFIPLQRNAALCVAELCSATMMLHRCRRRRRRRGSLDGRRRALIMMRICSDGRRVCTTTCNDI